MNWLNIKAVTAIVTAAFVTGTTVFLVKQSETNRLQNENRALIAQVNTMSSELEAAVAAATKMKDEIQQLKKDGLELLRLRGEVGVLRRQLSELQQENRELHASVSTASDQTSAQVPTLLSPKAGLNNCLNNLRMIDAAMQQCALEKHLNATSVITTEDILPYFFDHTLPVCPSGGTYSFSSLTNVPICSIPEHTLPSEAPIVELSLGVVMKAIIRDNNGRVPANDLAEDLAEAREAFKQDHNGQMPKEGINDTVPYLKQPGPLLRAAQDAFKQDHNGRAATNALELVPYF